MIVQSSFFAVLQKLANLQSFNVLLDVKQIVSSLQVPLQHYAELEFRSDSKQIDLITLSDDSRAINTFMEILKGRGITTTELVQVKALTRFGAGKVVGMKLPLTASSSGGEIYIRGALPLVEVNQFLSRYGVQPEALEIIEHLASIFGKTHTHMLGADATNPPAFTVFFTTYLTKNSTHTDQEQIKKALKTVGVNDKTINDFLLLHLLLGANRPQTLFFSWGIVDGKPVPQAKIDYEDVRLGVVAEVVNAVSITKQADNLIEWGRLLGTQKINYAGIVVGATELKTVRAYFTRRLPKEMFGD